MNGEPPLKIVCFGDSTTDNAFVPNSSTFKDSYKGLKVYSKWLEEKLPEVIGRKIEVINSGVNGDTTRDAMRRFNSDVLNHQPNMVIIQFGANDQCIRQDLGLKKPMVHLDLFTYNLLYFINRIRKSGSDVLLMTPGAMLWNKDHEKRFLKLPYRRNSKYGLNGHLYYYVEMIRKIAEKERVPLLDIYSAELSYDGKKNQNLEDLLPDGLHPNSKGHHFIAKIIINHFQKNYKS